MKVNFISRLAAVMLAVLMLLDLLASTNAIINGAPEKPVPTSNLAMSRLFGNSSISSRSFSVLAEDGVAFLGGHIYDLSNSPFDDVFHLELEQLPEVGSHVILEYETRGLENPEELPKSINGRDVFGSGELSANPEWKKARVRIPSDVLNYGTNSIRFSLPELAHLPVEVKNVSLAVVRDAEELPAMQPAVVRLVAESIDFEVLGENSGMRGFKASMAEVASMPTHIMNVTHRSYAYHLDGSNDMGYHVAIGVDASKLRSRNELNEVQVYYFDHIEKGWREAHVVNIDFEKLRVEAMVPGETDYFAGLITAPEMPEASAFLPTNVSDIEPANPAAGMQLMQAPTVSRTGSANINYPLWIPQGRNGMTPSLAVSYSSDAGSGWLGVGWSTATPGISVDTKWGVPTYSSSVESEGYILDGEALFQEGGFRPNKAVLDQNGNVITQNRQSAPSRFFPRVQQSYQEITRNGNNPSTYVWTVKDASGTTRYFGTSNGTSVNTNSVLRSGSSGPIAQWYLTKVEDQWGNTIDYEYTHYSNSTSNTMKNGGKGIYLSRVTYTGYGGDPGKYEIVYNTGTRTDGSVMLNYGFKVIDDRRLNSIDVNYDSQLLVEYKFSYSNDATSHFKTLLTDIIEERGGSEFYRHTMEYYPGELEYESSPQVLPINHGQSHLMGAPWYVSSIVNPLYTSIIPSPLQTSITEGSSGHGSIGVGLSGTFLGVTFDKTSSVNIGMSGSKSSTDIIRQMMDMNGDGLQDVLMDQGNKVYYRPITRSDDGALQIGSPRTVAISGFNQSVSSSFGGKVEVVGPKASGPVQIGLNYSRNRSETLRSLMDYNADGFPDLVYRSGSSTKVLFGEVDDQGHYSFLGSSENTYNPVIKGVNVTPPSDNDDFLKPMEIVRVWEAYQNGKVNISGVASLGYSADGSVDVALQYNDSFIAGGFQTVTSTSSHTFNQTIWVNKGDIIMFRSRSASDGQKDLLKWNPIVSYLGGNNPDGQETNWGTSSSQDGFVLSSTNGVSFDGTRPFRVVMNYSNTATLSDDMDLFIDVYVNGTLDETYFQTIPLGGTGSPNNTFAPFIVGNPSLQGYYGVPNLVVDDIVSLKFRLASSSNVQWDELLWLPTVELDPECDDPITELYTVPEYETYNNLDFYYGEANLGGIGPGDHQLLPNITVNSGQVQAVVSEAVDPVGVTYMTVKNRGLLAQKMAIVFNRSGGTITFKNVDMSNGTGPLDDAFIGNTTLSKSSFTYANQAYFTSEDIEDNCKIEFFAKGPYAAGMIQYIQNHLQNFGLYTPGGQVNTISPEEASYFYREYDEINKHYKHWGVFSWSPLTGEENQPIDPADLQLPLNSLSGQDPDTYDLAQIYNNPGQYNAEEFEFWSLQAIRGENDRDFWGYQDDNITALRDKDRFTLAGHHLGAFRLEGAVSPMILGEIDESYADPNINVGSFDPAYTAVGILNSGRSHTLSINGGAGQVSGSVNISDPLVFFSKQKALFTDLNGDGYPDILVDDSGIQGQFTNPLGGFQSQVSVSNVSRLSKGTSLGGNASWAGAYGNEDSRFRLSGSSISASMTYSKTRTSTIDINGDGLPDAYEDAVSYDRFRLGYGTGFENNHFDAQGTIRNQSYSVDVGATLLSGFMGAFSKYVKSISAGLNINVVGDSTEQFYHDFNGDGLMDYIYLSVNDVLHLNTGSGFTPYALNSNSVVPINENINKTESIGVSAQATLTLGPIISFLKGPVSGGYGDNFAINCLKTSFMDMNGDGVPDYIHAENGDLKIYLAKFGKLNLLKKVTNPLDGTFTINYEVVGNQRGYFDPVVPTHLSEIGNEKILWDMPMGKWVMSSVVVDDNVDVTSGGNDLDGTDLYETKFAYDGGIRLRREKEFAGFTRVATIQPNQLDILDDYCVNSSHFEVDEPRSTVGWYSCPEQAMSPQTMVTKTARYNMSVLDYEKPTGLEPSDFVEYMYRKDVVLHDLSLHVHEWKDEVDVADVAPCPPSGDGQYLRTDEWTHQHVELLSDKGIDYELRLVETGVSGTPGIVPPLGQVVLEEQDNWLIIEDVYTAETLPEYVTVFPATTDKRDINFPVVEDRDGVNIQKFHIKYDGYFNVVWFEDFGDLMAPEIDTIPIDTIYTGYYDVITQDNSCIGIQSVVQDIDGQHYFLYVECNDPTYEPDLIFGIYPYSSSCGNFKGIGPLTDCDKGELATFESTHRKWVVEETIIYNLVDASTYDRRIIATMDYFDPVNANDRTNALEVHKIWSQNTASNANMRRFTKVEALYQEKAPSQIGNYLSWDPNGAKALTDLSYDGYGNVTSVTGAENHALQRATTTYTYDSDVNQFVERIDNAYGEFVCNIYDYGYQQLLQTTGINGHKMRRTYDVNRRPLHIWAPREYNTPANGPTVSFSYSPGSTVPLAYTYHNTGNMGTTVTNGTSSSTCDALTDVSSWTTVMASKVGTATFTDGMDRIIQIQAESDWDDPATGAHTMVNKTRVSGHIEFNPFGLETLRRADFLRDASDFGTFQTYISDDLTKTTYDYVGRPVIQEVAWSGTTPSADWSITTVTHSWAMIDGDLRYMEETNADGKSITRTYLDHKGRQIATESLGSAWSAVLETTVFDYDDMGQLDFVEDPANQQTRYTYDFFGRVTQQIHADKGTSSSVYDAAGNVIEIHTEGTEESVANGFISMAYNYNRLTSKAMPLGSSYSAMYDASYVYGVRGDGKNGAGRVVSVTQGNTSSPVLVENRRYDELGHESQQVRVVDVPQVGTRTYTMNFRYDSFGRMLRAGYPGETLDYIYSSLGSLIAVDVTGICGNNPDLIDEISYDGYDNMVYMLYGNGAETEFGYHSITRGLMSSTVYAEPLGYSHQEVIDRQYSYNSLGMVSQVEVVPHRRFMSTSSKLTTSFTYDGLMRLKQATTDIGPISFNPADEPANPPVTYTSYSGQMYDVIMTYDLAGRIKTKFSQPSTSVPIANSDLDYDLTISYNSTLEHQITSASEVTPGGTATSTFEYNNSGSITKINRSLGSNTDGSMRVLWNEEQWIVADSNHRGIHHYVYDYTGERLMKSSYTVTTAWQNDNALSSTGTLDAYKVYVNPYIVKSYYDDNGVIDDETTYHYYMGRQRVASGRFNELILSPPTLKTSNDEVESPMPNVVLDQLEEVLEEFKFVKGRDFTREQLEEIVPTEVLYPEYSSTAKTDVSEEQGDLNHESTGGDENLVHCDGVVNTEVYWYHPNYLGSVDLVTNDGGKVHQFFLYNAWGESLNEYNAYSQGFDSPYRFNAKELDEETGLYYYGARYYDPKTSIWLSVDPLADHPNQIGMSPYSAFWNNPIIYQDPDGRCPDCPDPTDANEGDVANPNGTQEYIFTNGEWVGNGGTLDEVTVTASRPENQGGFGSGFVDGFGAGIGSTVDFFASLGTPQGWQDLGQGMMDFAMLGCQTCLQGMLMRAQMADQTINYVQNIPNMSAYEMGYDLGFGTEKLAEAVLISKGAGFGLNAARVGFGQAAFESSLIGGRSALFGRARLGSFGGNANGLLNRGYARIGWSYSKGTHYFQPRFGPKYGAKHYTPWTKYKP